MLINQITQGHLTTIYQLRADSMCVYGLKSSLTMLLFGYIFTFFLANIQWTCHFLSLEYNIDYVGNHLSLMARAQWGHSPTWYHVVVTFVPICTWLSLFIIPDVPYSAICILAPFKFTLDRTILNRNQFPTKTHRFNLQGN